MLTAAAALLSGLFSACRSHARDWFAIAIDQINGNDDKTGTGFFGLVFGFRRGASRRCAEHFGHAAADVQRDVVDVAELYTHERAARYAAGAHHGQGQRQFFGAHQLRVVGLLA